MFIPGMPLSKLFGSRRLTIIWRTKMKNWFLSFLVTTIALPRMFSAHGTSYIMLNGSFLWHGIFYEFLDNSNHYTGCGELQPIRWSAKSFYVGVFPSYADLMYFMTFIASCSFRLCRFFTRYREKESSSPDRSGNLVRVTSIMLE